MHVQIGSRDILLRWIVTSLNPRVLRLCLSIIISMAFTFVESLPAPAAAQGGNRCVSVVGDSVAYGDVVFELVGYGYVVARFAPISVYVEQVMKERGVEMPALDRSEPAVGLGSSLHPSYFSTETYQALLADHCQYTVIIPWLNDLEGASADTHLAAINQLILAIQSSNSEGKIIMVNYYRGAPAPFAKRTFASGLTVKNVAAFNSKLKSVCNDTVICLESSRAFVGLGTRYVAGRTTKAVFDSNLYAPLNAEGQALISAFFRSAPRGSILGDGVHLSDSGKRALARSIAALLQ